MKRNGHDCRIQNFCALDDDLCRAVLTTAETRAEFLWHEGWIIKRGHMRYLTSKRIGPGVYEVTLKPVKGGAA